MKSTNVSATCYPVYVVEFPVENSVCPCASRMLERCTPHARDLHSLNNVKQAAPRGPTISATCTNPPDERESGHRKARFAWKPFLCSCCTKRASIWRWGTGNRRVRRVGWGHRAAEPPLDVRSSRAFALRRPNDTKPVFPARFKRVKVAKRCWRRTTSQATRFASAEGRLSRFRHKNRVAATGVAAYNTPQMNSVSGRGEIPHWRLPEGVRVKPEVRDLGRRSVHALTSARLIR